MARGSSGRLGQRSADNPLTAEARECRRAPLFRNIFILYKSPIWAVGRQFPKPLISQEVHDEWQHDLIRKVQATIPVCERLQISRCFVQDTRYGGDVHFPSIARLSPRRSEADDAEGPSSFACRLRANRARNSPSRYRCLAIVGTKTPGRLLSGSAYKICHGYFLGLSVARLPHVASTDAGKQPHRAEVVY
jgi:hypothetical protein